VGGAGGAGFARLRAEDRPGSNFSGVARRSGGRRRGLSNRYLGEMYYTRRPNFDGMAASIFGRFIE
jgi:hypothetical protein